MPTDVVYDYSNPHSVGIVMKEAVRRAIMEIRRQRFIFEATTKAGHDGELNDMVTTADKAAQKIYVKMLTECFPRYGIVAEEEDLAVACTLPGEIKMFFTVDPLDGTKAFARKQSHGIGTMISLVCMNEVVAAYVGDAVSQEIFGFRPGSTKVHRISEFEYHEILAIKPKFRLAQQYVLMLTGRRKRSFVIRELVAPQEDGGLFRGAEIAGGSIGTNMARLWKGEVGAVVLNPGHNTPWDFCPIVGISKQLGFVFLRAEERKLVQFEPEICTQVRKSEHDVLVVHQTRLAELGPIVSSICA